MKHITQAGITALTILVLLFTSFSTSPRASAALDGPDDNYTILLQYGTIDTRQGEPVLAAELHLNQLPAGQPGYYIVQFSGIIQPEWRESLEAAGVEILGYLPNNAYLARMTAVARDQAAGLPHVQWIGVYQPAYRVAPSLASLPEAGTTGKLKVLTFPNAGLDGILQQMQAAGAQVLDWSETEDYGTLLVSAGQEIIPALARINGVHWIEPWTEPQLMNSVARGIMDVQDTVWGVQGLYGAGQIVAIADSGLDVGTFDSTMNDDFEGRITAAFALGRTNDWSDPHGHGTHVAGSVLGNGKNSGSSPAAHNYSSSQAGLAPEASLVFQSVMDAYGGLDGLPLNLTELFLPAFNAGARIHTNSWGSDEAGAYTTDSFQTDQFIWNHPDFTILFAAGNEGTDADYNGLVDLDSIGSPATAKNVITVGASENYRLSVGMSSTYGNYWYSDFAVNPIRDDFISNNANGMAAFSSRGPTDSGRIKPDVVAPGTNVYSVQTKTNGYTYMSGTSMATPLVAGGTALIREYYTDRGITPSAALVKATLINGAVDIAPGQYGSTGLTTETSTRPNNVIGWGRVNLQESLFPASQPQVRYWDVANASGLSTGGSLTYTYTVSNTSVPFRATLAYSDYPGLLATNGPIVNDIDLEVRTPSNQLIYPNNLNARDGVNNVEDIFIPAGSVQAGTYTITVRGYNVPQSKQGFGLVVRGGTFQVFLPAVMKTISVLPSILSNGSFESGSTYWQTYSEHGWPIIVHSNNLPGIVVPHGGSYAVWLGGEYDDTSYIQRTITLSPGDRYLDFWYWTASAEEFCGVDHARVYINGSQAKYFYLCENYNTPGWQKATIDLSSYAGSTITIRVQVDTDYSDNSNFFLDDFAFQSTGITTASTDLENAASYEAAPETLLTKEGLLEKE